MRQAEPVIEDSSVVEDVHHLRLTALLHELVRDEGKQRRGVCVGPGPQDGGLVHEDGKAVLAGAGGVGAGATVGGRLGWRPGSGSATMPSKVGWESWKGSSGSGLDEVRAAVAGEVEALREEQAKAMRHVERRLVRLEAGRSA